MDNRNSNTRARFLLPLLMGVVLAIPSPGLAQQSKTSEPYEETVIQGRVVCLDKKGDKVPRSSSCDLTTQTLGFVASGNKIYTFSSHDSTQAMLNDPRVFKQELRLRARLRSGQQLETIRIQAVKSGTLYDLYYFCDVCNITSYVPGPCPCCYQTLEFMEKPAADH